MAAIRSNFKMDRMMCMPGMDMCMMMPKRPAPIVDPAA